MAGEPEKTELTRADLTALGVHTGADLLLKRLADPFPAAAIGWKPQSVKGNRALALAYIDSRDVMDRLDEVIGPAGWEDRYKATSMEGGRPTVVCEIRIRVGRRIVRKRDVGGSSDQPDEGDRMKAAFSDAFKRAAVKFGIGRYLYRLPHQWADYDPQKRMFTRTPQLPEWALPESERPKRGNSQLRDAEKYGVPRPVVSGIPRLYTNEADEIYGLLRQAGLSQTDFHKVYDVNRIEDLPADKFKEAVERLRKKISPAA